MTKDEEIARLKQRILDLEKALEPMARQAERFERLKVDRALPLLTPMIEMAALNHEPIFVSDCFKARQVLDQPKEDQANREFAQDAAQISRTIGEMLHVMEINLNGSKVECRPTAAGQCRLTYEEIVDIACEQLGQPVDGQKPLLSVVFRHRVPFDQLPGERSGMVGPGESVAVTPGMVISAMHTGNA